MKFFIWEGVYESFPNLPKSQDGHLSREWINRSRKRLQELLRLSKINHSVKLTAVNRDSLLPFLASLEAKNGKKASILDFGGGMGFTYISVVSTLLHPELIDYHIVELKPVIEAAAKIFGKQTNLTFHENLSSLKNTFDIIHFSSSLQYVNDWKNLLRMLSNFKPQYFLFSDLYAGNIPTYATFQNYYGSKMPCWFFNLEEFINVMKNMGFSLIFKSAYVAKILGKEQESPQSNFPKEYRLGNACNLLFYKK